MEDQQVVTTEPTPVSSFMTRATNVFAAPNELYSEVAVTPPQTSSWLIPFLLSIVVAIVITFAIYNNPTIRQQIYDMQSQGMREAVEQGRMTQEQMDQATEAIEGSGPVMFMLIGGGGAIFSLAIMFFGGVLIVWLASKLLLKFPGGYKKMLEIYGLAALIGILGSIVTLLTMNVFDSLYATPSGAMFVVDSFDPKNKAHQILAMLNVFTIWQVAVLGFGLAKVSGKSAGSGMGLAFGLWIVWVIIASLIGIGIVAG